VKPRPKTFFALVMLLLGLVALGAFAFSRQVSQGDVVTGMRTLGAGGAVWGLYVVMDGFLLGTGIVVMAAACLARFSRDKSLEALARIAMPVAIACFLGAALSVMADQGRPLLALMNLSLFARPQSPFFVTFTTVAGVCLYGSLIHCVLACRPDLAAHAKIPSRWQPLQRLLAAHYTGSVAQRYRRQKVSFWMSLLMLPALLATLTALAIIFTVRPGRPLGLTLVEVVAFFLQAVTGGLGALVGATALVEYFAGPAAGLAAAGYLRLGRSLLVAVSLSLLSWVGSEWLGLASKEPAAVNYAKALLVDRGYAPLFWTALGCLFVSAALLWHAAYRDVLRPRIVVGAGILAQLGVLLHRYLLLVAWQTHGLSLPYGPGNYRPTWIEAAVVLGIVAFCSLLLLPAVRLIPFVPATPAGPLIPSAAQAQRRALVTAIWCGTGLAATTVGLAFSFRLGTDSFLDPALTASPVMFIAGLAMVATTGAVYELFPDPRA
jgi:Ni/Fe-hydrogenase subunit HybB-like protein